MHNDVTRHEARGEFWSLWSRREKYFKMATVESECLEVLSCLLEAIQTNEDPSSFENSCTGPQRLDNSQNQCSSQLSSSNFTRQSGGAASPRERVVLETSADIFNSDKVGWIKSLEKLPGFTHEKLENKLVKNSRTMPDKVAPKAYRNMKKGYGLWKEGYVKSTFVKPNVQASKLLFLVKARVCASMKSVSLSRLRSFKPS